MTKELQFHASVAFLLTLVAFALFINWDRLPHLAEIDRQYESHRLTHGSLDYENDGTDDTALDGKCY